MRGVRASSTGGSRSSSRRVPRSLGRACQSRESGCRTAAAFARSPSAPGGALLPTNPLSEGLWGHPRPSCLPLCPPGLHPGLLTSPFCQPGPLGCSGSGQGPAPGIPPALPLACGEGAEERRGGELEWGGMGRKPLRHRDLKSPREAEAGGPGREQSSRAKAPPTRPRVNPSGRGGAVGASAHSFLLAPFTSPRPSFPLTRRSLPGHPRPQGASAAAAPPAPAWHVPNSLRGWGRHRRGLKLQRAGGTRPSSPTLLLSPTFSEQLRLAALQGTDLPGQSLLQHL